MDIEQANNTPFRHRVKTLTVLSGQQQSGILDVQGLSLLSIVTPAALTSTIMTLKTGGHSDGSGNPIVKDFYNVLGTEVQIQIAADRNIGIAAIDMAPVRFIQIKTDQVEVADRIFSLILRTT